jgi:hypothetical protein
MFRNRENIRIIPIDAIIILAIVVFGLLIHNNPVKSIPVHKSSPVSYYIAVSESNAVSNPYITLQVFQKTWILNKDNYNILAFNCNPLTESQKTGISIGHFLALRQNLKIIPQFILRYHLFPKEPDAFPYLS